MAFRSIAAGAAFAAMMAVGPVTAAPLPVSDAPAPLVVVQEAQANYNTRGFRRCMRAKYGPRYFARVNRAHRWHMSQACMA